MVLPETRRTGPCGRAARHAGPGPDQRRHAEHDRAARTARDRHGHQPAGPDAIRRGQNLRKPADLFNRAEAAARPRQILGGLGGRPDLHLPPARKRQVARRQAVHLRRRRVFAGGHAAQDPCPRPRDPEQVRGFGAGAGREDRRRQAEVALPRLHADVRTGLCPHHAQASLRGHRLHDQPRQPEAGRHGPLHVQGVEARRIHQADPQPRLLEAGQALSG
ncbi:hypothetical protein D9M68_571860 [compost metagenome]